MKIYFDARMWDHPGIGRYVRELSRALLDRQASFGLHFLGNDGLRRSLGPSAQVVDTKAGIYSIAEQWEIGRKVRGAELFHAPHFNVPIFFGGKMVVTIHDLIYLKDPKASRSALGPLYVSMLFKAIRRNARAIITVSESTKRDLLSYWPGYPAERISVIYEGASPIFKKIEDADRLASARAKHGLGKPFILFVGSLKAHKNIPTLVSALEGARRDKGLEHELVIVGRPDPKNPELLRLVQNTSFVRYLGEVPDEDLLLLYNLADLFVIPSFEEGFGLPLLEAMSCGTPVAASNRTSIPEVGGEAALYFEPNRIDALSELIYNVLSSNKLRQNMARQSLERAKHFSWAKTAQATLGVYEKVLNESSVVT